MSSFFSSEPHPAFIQSNLVQPGRKPRRIDKSIQLLIRLRKRILREILGFLAISDIAANEAINPLLPALNKQAKRGPITVQRHLQQILVAATHFLL